MELRIEAISFQSFIDREERHPGKHELINGYVVAYAGGTSDHHQISGNVVIWLSVSLKAPCRAFVSDAIVETVTHKAQSGLRPDVVVTCSEQDFGRARYISAPRIAIEVRSPSNVGPEWDSKLFQYWNTACIEQFIVIESEERHVESFVRNVDGTWADVLITRGSGLLEFPSVGNGMPLEKIYERTSLLQAIIVNAVMEVAAPSRVRKMQRRCCLHA